MGYHLTASAGLLVSTTPVDSVAEEARNCQNQSAVSGAWPSPVSSVWHRASPAVWQRPWALGNETRLLLMVTSSSFSPPSPLGNETRLLLVVTCSGFFSFLSSWQRDETASHDDLLFLSLLPLPLLFCLLFLARASLPSATDNLTFARASLPSAADNLTIHRSTSIFLLI